MRCFWWASPGVTPRQAKRSLLFRKLSSPARRYRLDDSKHHQTEPKIHGHTQVDLERRMMRAGRKILFEQEVDRIPDEHGGQSVEKIGGRFGH